MTSDRKLRANRENGRATAICGQFTELAAQGFVGFFLELFLQFLDQFQVSLVAVGDGVEPDPVGLGVGGDGVGLDVLGDGLVNVALT